MNQPQVPAGLSDYLPPERAATRSPEVDRLYSLWVGSGTSPGRRHFHLLYGGGARLARTLELEEALVVLEQDLQLYLGARAPRRIFVHAGVVGWRGRAILFPGRSMTGKTTVVAALVRAGAIYYSDEYAVLDSRGRVHPYPRALAIRGAGGEPPHRCPAQALGARTGARPLPVGLVVATSYQPGARWRPRALTAGQALCALFANTVPARIQPERSLAALRQVVSLAPALDGRRGEAEELIGPLLRPWCDERGLHPTRT